MIDAQIKKLFAKIIIHKSEVEGIEHLIESHIS